MGQQKNASKVVIATLAMVMSTSAFAQGGKKGKSAPTPPAAAAAPAPSEAKATKGDDKVDISDLESKYWAPKDTDFSVVQNRTYSKEHRFMIAPEYGTVINDPYSEGNVYGLTANYFWSERMGVQATWLKADLKNNDATNDIGRLSATAGATPDHGKLTGYYGVGFNLVPFYAKMSFWGKRIIYFDMAFTPTVGFTQYEQQIEGAPKEKSAFTYGIDVTQYFFFSRWFAIRADLKNNFYKQEVVKYRNTAPFVKGQKVKDKDIQDTMFLLGAEFYF
jgi:outer membrane beta-barrel protein